jgi:hypothetical protein
MGPFGNTRKGALSFCAQDAPAGNDWDKRGHVVRGNGAVENEEKEGFLLDHQAIASDESSRAAYLERENARLQRLVAELLVSNEQLRQQYLATVTVAD